MVEVITGAGLGLERNSALLLGSGGGVGNPALARANNQVYVNSDTGNLVVQDPVELLTGVGLDATLGLTYNSLGQRTDDNGDNWASVGSQILNLTGTVNTTGSTIQRLGWDGSLVTYTYDANKNAYSVKEQSGAYDTLSWNGGAWKWTEGSTQITETYNAALGNRVATRSDIDGNTVTYAYTGNLLTKATTADGEYIALSYTGNNLTQIVTTLSGGATLTRTRYSYDAQNRLSTITVDLSPADNSITDGNTYVTTYSYVNTTSALVSSIQQSDGSRLDIAYDSSNRVASTVQWVSATVSRTTTYAYATGTKTTVDLAGNSISLTGATVTDPQGNVTTLWYDAKGFLWQVYAPPAATGGNAQITDYKYDGFGNLVRVSLYDGQANQSAGTALTRTDYAYDTGSLVAGNAFATAVPSGFNGNQTVNNGNLLRSEDLLGNVTDYTYNASNQILTRIAYTGTDADGLAGSGNPGGTARTSFYVYDANKNLAYTVSPEGRVVQYNAASNGLVRSETDFAANLFSTAAYSSSSPIPLATLNSWVAAIADKSTVQRTDYLYDFRGNLASEIKYSATDASGNGLLTSSYTKTTYVYDQSGELLQKLINTGASNVAASSNFAASTSSNVVSSAATINGQAASKYVIQTTGSWSTVTSPLLSVAANSTVTSTFSIQAINAAATADFSIYGNASGWGAGAAVIVSGPGTLVATGSGTWRLTGLSTTQATLVEVTRTFTQADSANLVVAPDWANGFQAGNGVILNNLQISVDQSAVSTYAYDGLGRVLSQTVPNNSFTTSYGDGSTQLSAILANGQVQSLTTMANGLVKTSVYDRAGELVSAATSGTGIITGTTSYVYDSLGQVRVATDATGISTYYFYDKEGRKVAQVDGNGVLNEYDYDAASRLVATVTFATPLTAAQLASLAPNNGVPSSSTLTAIQPLASAADRWSWNVYDAAGRVIQQIDPLGDVTAFSYDGTGALLQKTSYANALSATQIAALKASTPGANLLYNPGLNGTAGWTSWNGNGILNSGSPFIGSGQGFDYIKAMFTATASGQCITITNTDANRFLVTAGQQLTIQSGVEASGPVGTTQLMVWWYGASGNSISGTIVGSALSGAQAYNSQITGAVITPAGAVSARIEYYVWTNNSGSGWISVVEPKVTIASNTLAPVAVTANATSDRTITNFYSNDGLLVGTLDADGFLTQYDYDAAGRQIDAVRYANAASVTSGTFAQVLASITASSTDQHNYTIYDGRGFAVATIDGEGNLTRYHYTARGDADQIVRGQQVTPNTTYTLATLPAAPGGTVLETTSFTRNAAGQVLTQVKALAGSGTETTTYAYDITGNLLTATTAESISSDTRTTTNVYDVKGRLIVTLSGIGSYALAQLGASPTQAQINAVYTSYGIRYSYDAADRLISKTEPDGRGGAGNTTLYYYDNDGRLRAQIDALGEVTEYRYTAFGQRSDAIVYATRLSSTTLASLSGGLVNATLTNALVGLASSADTISHYDYNVTGTMADSVAPFVRTGLGQTTTYSYDAFGEEVSRTAPVDAGVSVTTVSSYNRRGLLKSTLSDSTALALTMTYTYDGFGRLATATDANGTVRTTGYDRNNRVVSQIDGLGQTTSLGYDARGNLITSTDRNGKVTTFAYDAFNRNITTTTPEGVVTTVKRDAYGDTIQITDGAGRVTTYAYNRNGSLNLATNAAGSASKTYDMAGRLVDEIDAKGVDTHYTYDAANRVLTRVQDYGTGKLNLTTTYAYDAKGEVISVTDPSGVVTTYGYDPTGDKVKVVQDANGLKIETDYVYRADGKITDQIDAVGTSAQRTTHFVYDDLGRNTQKIEDYGTGKLNITTSYAYDADNNVIAVTDALGRVTHYVYDANNRLIYSVDAMGEVTQTGYDAEGRVVSTRAFAATVPTATLNGFGLAITASQVTSAVAISASDHVNRTLYDGNGRAVYQVDGEGYVTQNVYDGANNVIQTIRYTGAVSVTDTVTTASLKALLPGTVPSDAVVTGFAYDASNRLTDVTDGTGMVTHYALDALGQITDTTVAYGTSDAATTHRVFDNLGRVTSETKGYGTSEASTSSYLYNALGLVTQITDGDGWLKANYYDSLGRLTYVRAQIDSDPTHDIISGFGYDARGNRTAVIDPRGYLGYFYYDNLDRLVLQVDPLGFMTATTYSIGRNISSITHYAIAATGSYNATTQPNIVTSAKDETTSFTRDKLDRVTSTTDAAGSTESYVLDAFGNRTQLTNKLGGVTTYTYDRRNLLKSQTVIETSTNSAGTVTASSVTTNYSYDSRGNRLTMVEAAGLAEQRTTTYTYDKLDRLLSQAGDQVSTMLATGITATNNQVAVVPTTSYVYDRRGNRIATTDANGATTCTYYDHLNRKVGEISPVGTLTVWAYDANSNVSSQTVYGDAVALPSTAGGATPSPVNAGNYRQTLYNYDRNNRLLGTTVQNMLVGYWNGGSYVTATRSVTLVNVYDASGNVIQTTDGNGVSTYHWFDKVGHEIATLDGAKYLTTYSRDQDGNVLTETRYANAVTGTISTSTVPTVTSDAVNDRTTQFTYDKMGRRLTETRLNVAISTVGASDTIGTTTGNATVTYTYNGLGEVATKQEATGDTTTYAYDAQGRQTQISGPAFTDYTGTNVQQIETLAYDGLNDVTRTVGNSVRVTTYNYGAGGRLQSMTDASGFTTSYFYDGAGRQTVQIYQRFLSNGAGSTEAKLVGYDAAGRVNFQGFASNTGPGVWMYTGDRNTATYDTYGDVTARLLNGVAQEQFVYDAAGHLVASNQGDGSWKVYVNDANGNATLTITSSGTTDLSTLTQAQALALATNNGANTAGAVAGNGVNVTIGVFNGRNQQTETRAPLRDSVLDGQSAVTQNLIDNLKTYNAFGEVSSQTDARGNTTNFTYTTEGKLASQVNPQVNVTAENGAVSSTNPTQYSYYDASGRLIGTRDADGNLITRTLLAGTGYGGSDALITAEYHPDGGTKTSGYDVFLDDRKDTNEIGQVTTNTYDAMDRLIEVDHPLRANGTPGGDGVTQLKDYYAYDGLGQRIQHWNNVLTNPGTYSASISSGGITATGVGYYQATPIPPYGSLPAHLGGTFTIPTASLVGTGVLTITRNGTSYGSTTVTASNPTQSLLLSDWAYSPGTSATYLIQQQQTNGAYITLATVNVTYSVTVAVETVDYDAQGRVVSTVDFMGHKTATSYTWNAARSTSGLGAYGGWDKLVTYVDAAKSSTDTVDAFGHEIYKSDLAGTTYAFGFDKIGHLTTKTSSAGESLAYTYFNSGLVKTIVDNSNTANSTYYTSAITSQFTYDRNGNRLTSNYSSTSHYSGSIYGQYYTYTFTTVMENSAATYDAMNRITSITDPGDVTNKRPSYTLTRAYDANGNIREAKAIHQNVDSNQNLLVDANNVPTTTTDDYWYRYDSMNRFIITKGSLSGTAGAAGTGIVAGTTGISITYNAAGQRMTATSSTIGAYGIVYYNQESYAYTADGYLSSTSIASATGTGAFSTPTLEASDTRDALGRVTAHAEYSGTTQVVSRTATYNNDNQVTSDSNTTVQSGHTWVTTDTYGYATYTLNTITGLQVLNVGSYANGQVISQSSSTTEDGTYQYSNMITNSFVWSDGPQQSVISNTYSGNQSGTTTSTFSYDKNNHVSQVTVTGQAARTLSYTTDSVGQVMARKQTSNGSTTAPEQFYFYFNGVQIGQIGNNGDDNTNYASAINREILTPGSGPFQGGATTGVSSANFDENYQAMNPTAAGEAGVASTYMVQSGDTLAGIAAQVWGDSSLWYVIAQANGIQSDNDLAAGMQISIPNKVENIHDNSTTFKVYNPAKALGDVQPGAPVPPPSDDGCGVFGAILMAVIAIAIVVVLHVPIANLLQYGSFWAPAGAGVAGTGIAALTTASIVEGFAIAGALGSIVSQGIGIAVGIQKSFNFGAVALSALGAAVGGEINESGIFDNLSTIAEDAATGAATSLVTQGVAVATGLQDKFDWAGVAVGAVGAAVSGVVLRGLAGDPFTQNSTPKNPISTGAVPNFGQKLIAGVAGSLAGAATRSVLTGTDFSDNIIRDLPTTIANTVGDLIGDEIQKTEEAKQRSQGISRLAALPGLAGLSKAELANAYDTTHTFDSLAGAPVGTALTRVEGDQQAQADLSKLVRVQMNTTPYLDSLPPPPPVQGVDDPTIIVTAPRPGTVEYALAITRDAFQSVGGLSDEDASAAVAPLREQYDAARINTRPSNPAFGSFASDNFVSGTGQALSALSATLNDHPLAAYTLTAVAFAAGPIKFAVGYGVSRLTDPLVGLAAQKSYAQAANVGYDQLQSKNLAIGVAGIGAAIIGIATGGIGKFQGLFGGATRALEGVAAESATVRAARLGAEGEQAVGLFGPKVGIRIPGANNLRFPDNLTTTTLTEVKNVASQGLTKQLRDYITVSQSTGRTFDLYVRPSTRLTSNLEAAILRGDINLKYIPGAK